MNKGVRKNIYVPNQIANRMKNYPDINWSGLASIAFRDRMDYIDNLTNNDLVKEYGPRIENIVIKSKKKYKMI